MVNPMLHPTRSRLKKGNCLLEVTQLIHRSRIQTPGSGSLSLCLLAALRHISSPLEPQFPGCLKHDSVFLSHVFLGTRSRLAEVGVGGHLRSTPSDGDPTYAGFAVLNMHSAQGHSKCDCHSKPTEKEQGGVCEGRGQLWLLSLLITFHWREFVR